MAHHSFYQWFARVLLIMLIAGLLPAATGLASPSGLLPATLPAANDPPQPPSPPVGLTVAPQAEAHLPSMTLRLEVAPSPVAIGETVAITLTIANQAPDPAEDLVVTLPTPEGALALPGPNTRGPAQGWQWNVGRLDGHAETTLLGTLRLVRRPAGDALLLHAQAAARGLPLPIHAIGGAVVIERAGDPAAAPFAPGAAARLQSRDGRVQVAFPARAAARALTLRHTYAPRVGAAPPALAGYRRGFGTFFLDATDDQGNPVHQFDQPLAISVGYTSEQLQALGIAESDLSLFWFNEQAQRWDAIPTSVDPATQTATALVDHFSAFQLGDGSSPSTAFIPSLQGWQVSAFTGAASYSYPIDVPAGPAGLKPNLMLTYSSAANDGDAGKRVKQQAGWVGLGWSLDTGSVAANKMSNGTVYYTLVLNGQSFDLVRGAALVANPSNSNPTHWDWRPTDESFILVRAVANGVSTATRGGFTAGNPEPRYTWQIFTKDGTRHDFNEDLWWGFEDCSPEGDYAYMETYKWLLNSVTDTHGNVINYTYGRDSVTADVTCGYVQGTVDRDAWPTGVNWGGGRYQVNFISVARAADTQFEGADNQYPHSSYAPHQTRQLNAIKVIVNPAGTWQLVRQYNFGYDYSLYSDVLAGTGCPAGQPKCPDTNYPRLTLKTIQRLGNDGSGLPLMSFSYGAFSYAYTGSPLRYWAGGSWNRLIQVNNGQGGLLNFAYDNAGQVVNNGLMDNNRRVTSKTLNDGLGHNYTTAYTYGTPNVNSLGTTRGPQSPWSYGNYGTQAYPNSAALYYNAFTDTLHDYRYQLAHKPLGEFRGHDRVIETDPSGGQTRHWFYQGEASDKCTPTVGGGSIPNDACFQRLRNGEFLKGREYRTEVFAAGANVNSANPLLESLHSFTVTFYDYSAMPYSGLWRAFSYESQAQEEQQEGTTTAVVKTTRYIHEPSYTDTVMGLVTYQANGQQYGNLTRVEEYDGPLDGRAPVRITEHMFTQQISAGSYIVDREWGTVVRDGQRRQLALTQFYFDGNNQSPATLGTKGDVTRASRFYDLPLQVSAAGITLHGPDTTFTYDTYGNRLTESTYEQPGTRKYLNGVWTISTPGAGSAARTTSTVYDSVFHAFPTQITNPLGHITTAGYDYRIGTLTSVIDPNSNTTSVQYDVFGRLAALIKPGDSASFPTVQATYYDTELPFRYRIDRREVAGNASTQIEQHYYDGLGREIQAKRESVNVAQNIVLDRRYDGLDQVTEESQPRYINQSGAAFEDYTVPAATLYNVTTTTYDALGRPRRITTPDGKWTEHFYGVVVVNSVPYTYDDVVDPNRHRRQYRRDALSRLAYVQEINGNCGTSSYSWATCAAPYTTPWTAAATTTYSYNPLDLLAQVADTAGNTTTMTYDSLGRKATMNDPDMGAWSYGYDANGNLMQQLDAKGQTISFDYDALDRLISKGLPGNQQQYYAYDDAGVPNGKGRRTAMSVWSGGAQQVHNSWEYNARGQVTLAALNTAGMLLGLRYYYDSGERLTTFHFDQANENISYTYDAAWRPTSMCTNLGGCYVTGATYTALDQPDVWTFGNGVTQNWSYSNPLQRPSQLQIGAAFDRSYGYDNGGNVTAITDNKNAANNQSFGYDDRSRLTSWTLGAGPAQSYSYDAIGNLINKAGASFTYGPQAAGCVGGALDRAHVLVSAGGMGYCYDQNGNMTSGSGWSYSWNADNMLASMTNGSTSESYTYNADGERVKRTSGGVTTVYFTNAWELVVGGASKRYYSFNGQIVAMRDSSTNAVTYLHGDHLGSISLTTSSSGAAGQTQEFDPWGSVRSGGISATSFNYTGQRRDSTGLLYYNARYYNPVLARFVSADTVVPGDASGSMNGTAFKPLTVDFHEPGFVSSLNRENQSPFWFQMSGEQRQQAGSPWGPANPQALNRYSYVLNNPVRYTDPTGHWHDEKETHNASYEPMCKSKKGGAISCHADEEFLDPSHAYYTDSQGRILYKLTFKKEQPYGARPRTYVTYGYQGDPTVDSFMKSVDEMYDASEDFDNALGISVGAECKAEKDPCSGGISISHDVMGAIRASARYWRAYDNAMDAFRRTAVHLPELVVPGGIILDPPLSYIADENYLP